MDSALLAALCAFGIVCMVGGMLPPGTWGPWTIWTTCSVTCGNGFEFRTRRCASPPCVGPDFESRPCSTGVSCPCASWEFTCNPSGVCIPLFLLCDDYSQCPDNSDESSCVNCIPGDWEDWTKVKGKQSCFYERSRPILRPAGVIGRPCTNMYQSVRCTNDKCSTRPCGSDFDCSFDSFCGIHPSGKREPTCCSRDSRTPRCKLGNDRACLHHWECNYMEYCHWDKMNHRSACCPISRDDLVCPGHDYPPPLYFCDSVMSCPMDWVCTESSTSPYSYCCPPPFPPPPPPFPPR